MSESSNKDDESGIPSDPSLWSELQVFRWMVWVLKEFGHDSSVIQNYGIDGKKLCTMTQSDCILKFPYGNIFWDYLDILKKIVENPSIAENLSNSNALPNSEAVASVTSTTISSSIDISKSTISSKKTWPHFDRSTSGNRTAHSGQIQLWQFLLEMLTDADCRDYISWVGDNGEFKLLNPHMVAQMWGERKNKPAMNYEKLSRALRYYYDSEIISKVPGKRFVYKFVCNLKELVGFDAAELDKLVRDCVERRRNATDSRSVDEYLHNPTEADMKPVLTDP